MWRQLANRDIYSDAVTCHVTDTASFYHKVPKTYLYCAPIQCIKPLSTCHFLAYYCCLTLLSRSVQVKQTSWSLLLGCAPCFGISLNQICASDLMQIFQPAPALPCLANLCKLSGSSLRCLPLQLHCKKPMGPARNKPSADSEATVSRPLQTDGLRATITEFQAIEEQH